MQVCEFCEKNVSYKNISRHKKLCHFQVIKKLKDEINQLKAEVIILKEGREVARLTAENNDLKNQLIESLNNKNKRARSVTINHHNHIEKVEHINNKNISINVCAFGEEPQLEIDQVRNIIRQCSRVDLNNVVPTYLEAKHFEQKESRNIRVNDNEFEIARKDARTGVLKWVREKDPDKFCKDLAMQSVSELNTNYQMLNNMLWRAFHNNRFEDPTVDKVEMEKEMGQNVKKMMQRRTQCDQQSVVEFESDDEFYDEGDESNLSDVV
jgi:uncharacterized small protein (DUF1192 family)